MSRNQLKIIQDKQKFRSDKCPQKSMKWKRNSNKNNLKNKIKRQLNMKD